jgi:DNA primase
VGGFIRCPFHPEKTPSFSTYDHGQKWKCFGCGESGDVISLVMKLYNLNFGQAIMRLDSDFGLGLSSPSRGRRERAQIFKAILEYSKKNSNRK